MPSVQILLRRGGMRLERIILVRKYETALAQLNVTMFDVQ